MTFKLSSLALLATLTTGATAQTATAPKKPVTHHTTTAATAAKPKPIMEILKSPGVAIVLYIYSHTMLIALGLTAGRFTCRHFFLSHILTAS